MHKFRFVLILEEEVDGVRNEVIKTYAERPAATVHRAVSKTMSEMAAEAAIEMAAIFKKSRTGGGR